MTRVSVLMLTYNHRPFVEQAIRSVLDQVLAENIHVSLIVADDASTDGTADVIGRLAAAHPETITPILRPANLGMFGNLADLWRKADGDYIALIEGDDFWTRPDKLRRQIEAMERHPSWSMSFHRTVMVDESDEPLEGVFPGDELLREGISATALAIENFVPNNSVMYRFGLLSEIPEWLAPLQLLDWPIHLLHAKRGEIGFIDVDAAAYRVHAGGVWSALTEINRMKALVTMSNTLLAHEASPSIRSALRTRRANAQLAMASAFDSNGDRRGARRLLLASLTDQPFDPRRLRARLSATIRLCLPRRRHELS